MGGVYTVPVWGKGFECITHLFEVSEGDILTVPQNAHISQLQEAPLLVGVQDQGVLQITGYLR